MVAGHSVCTTVPTAPPSIAPMNSEGAKIPPDPPDPIVMATATIFTATSITMKCQSMVPLSAWLIAS